MDTTGVDTSQKWDESGWPKEKKRKHKHNSDLDSRSKLKKNMMVGFNRRANFEGNKRTGGEKILQGSRLIVPTLEENSGTYGMPSKPTSISNLPKIHKL